MTEVIVDYSLFKVPVDVVLSIIRRGSLGNLAAALPEEVVIPRVDGRVDFLSPPVNFGEVC